MKIEMIPIGKENKVTRIMLMKKMGLNNSDQLKTQLAELKQNYIILYDEGYYRPKTKEDYENFINKCNEQTANMKNLIELANREMEKL